MNHDESAAVVEWVCVQTYSFQEIPSNAAPYGSQMKVILRSVQLCMWNENYTPQFQSNILVVHTSRRNVRTKYPLTQVSKWRLNIR